MTDFPNKAAILAGRLQLDRIIGIGVILAVAGLSASVCAQERAVTGPPRGLSRDNTEQPADRNGQTPPAVRSLDARPGMDEDGILIGTLSGVDDAGLGSLSMETGGFGRDVWTGSDRRALELLIPLVPVGAPSATMAHLTQRLLLTAAPFPAGVTSGASMLNLRLERLFVAGLVDDMLQLAELSLATSKNSETAHYAAWGYLVRRQPREACEIASELTQGSDQPKWLKLRTLCFALSGEHAAADLTLGLWREQDRDDPVFAALATRLTTQAEIDIPSGMGLDPVHMALYAEIGIAPGEADVRAADPVILAALARDERFAEDLRLFAAQWAEHKGAVTASELGVLFDRVQFSHEDVANALSVAATLAPARASALLYRAVKSLTVPSASAEVLRAAFSLAHDQGLYLTAARLYWPVVQGLEPAEPYAEIASDIGRLALIAGEFDLARAWYDLARQSVRADAKAARGLRLLLAIPNNGYGLPWRPTESAKWLADAPSGGALFARRVDEILALEVLGYAVNNEIRTRFLAAPPRHTGNVTSSVILARLDTAIERQQVGEIVLLSLIALGPAGPGHATMPVLSVVHRGFKRIGLDQEARQIFVEALLDWQLATP